MSIGIVLFSIGHHLSYIYEADGLPVQSKDSSRLSLQEKYIESRPKTLVLVQVELLSRFAAPSVLLLVVAAKVTHQLGWIWPKDQTCTS